MTQETILLVISLVSAILSTLALGVGSVALLKIMAVERSTHKVEYIQPPLNLSTPKTVDPFDATPEEMNDQFSKIHDNIFNNVG